MCDIKGKILVVDDDDMSLVLIRKMLEHNFTNISIDTASGAIEAMGILNHGGYDVVITDINMPNIDGFQLFDMARDSNPEMSWIFISSDRYTSHKDRNGETVHVLVRPFTKEDIEKRVELALRLRDLYVAYKKHKIDNAIAVLKGQYQNAHTG